MPGDGPDGSIPLSDVVREEGRQIVSEKDCEREREVQKTLSLRKRREQTQQRRLTESTRTRVDGFVDDVVEARNAEEESEDGEDVGILGEEGVDRCC